MTSPRNWSLAIDGTEARARATGLKVVGIVATTAAGIALFAGPALADPPPEEPLAGVSINCDGGVLTFTGGVQVGDLRRVQLGNGGQVVISDVVLHGATLTDEAGAIYRAVGSANSTARIATEGDAEGATGHFNVNLTVLGDNGRLGRLWLRERVARDGTVTTVSGGGCTF